MLNAALALLPVTIFLGVLLLLDSFKLVRISAIAGAIGWGALAALLSIPATTGVEQLLHLSPAATVRYAGPLVEETLKLAFVAILLRRRRIGFLVDAAVFGFAVGTGFALVENLVFLRALGGAAAMLWVVRGLGTAILHGGTTSVAAMLAKAVADQAPGTLWRPLALGWAPVLVVHSAFNHLLLPPLAATLLLLVAFPLVIVVVFQRSEAATREWVGAGMDLDLTLLELVTSEHFAVTRFGRYLEELRARFPGYVVVDMFCLLRLQLELSIQAKAMLMARQAGLVLPPHPDVAAGLEEQARLRHSIGRAGLLALAPLGVSTHRDDWHRFLVADARPRWLARLRRQP